MSPRRLRLGLIGAGRRGQAHAATIGELPELYEFVAVCDVNEASARAVAAHVGARPYAELAELFAHEQLDAVCIATPPETHHLLARAAADHRVHMLIETPLAPTRAMMDVIAEAAATAGVWVEVGENYGRRPAERLNQTALQAGLIGRVLHLSAFNAPANGESCYHMMSLFQLYAGADVAEIRACAYHARLDPEATGGAHAEVETWVDAVLTFENGITASCSYVTSWTAPLRWGRPRITTVEGTAGYIVTGDGGTNTLRRVENGVARDYGLGVETRPDAAQDIPIRYVYDTSPPVEVLNPFADRRLTDVEAVGVADGLARAAELVSLHRAVTDGVEPEYGIARARRAQELGIAIIEAARLERPLPASLGEETPWEQEQHEALRARWGADPLRDIDLILKQVRR